MISVNETTLSNASGASMLEPAKVFGIIDAVSYRVPTETVPLTDALGRVMPGGVQSRIASPPFDKAAMDGYAVSTLERRDAYRVVETVAAGDTPQRMLQQGECAAIMTGAMLPFGADKVIRREYTTREGDTVRVTKPEPLENIIKAGENCSAGDIVLTPRVIRAQDIGVAASVGVPTLEVARRAHVGVISTGSELRSPGEELGGGQIYNSNGYQITAQMASYGCTTTNHGVVSDEREQLAEVVKIALQESDIVILSGGVSMGEFDYVPSVLAECGVEIAFHKIAFKPGKPTLFGRKGDSFVFGLAGNPVSTFVLCEVLVKRLLLRISGLESEPALVRGELGADVKRKLTDRIEYRPAWLNDGVVHPIMYQGSAHLNVLSEANCLFWLNAGVDQLSKGTAIDVRPI